LSEERVHDAVRDDDVEACGFEAEFAEALDITFVEFDIRPRMAEAVHVPADMRLRDGELFGRHVDTGHEALRPDEAGQRIDVAPRAAAEIEHAHPLDLFGDHEAAAVIARQHLVMDERQRAFHMLGHGARVAAGIRLEVARAFQRLAVIFLHALDGHAPLRSDCFAKLQAAWPPAHRPVTSRRAVI